MSRRPGSPGLPARTLNRAIGAYQQLISPLLGPRCRFAPSCSHYAQDAITRYGAGYGSWLAVRRILRCHPFNPGGWDPVPERPVRGGKPSRSHASDLPRTPSSTTGATR
jgi:putative membrane protein insertion efficiency factor